MANVHQNLGQSVLRTQVMTVVDCLILLSVVLSQTYNKASTGGAGNSQIVTKE